MDEDVANARNIPERQRRYFETIGRVAGLDVLIPMYTAGGGVYAVGGRLPSQKAADQLRLQVIPDLELFTQESLAKLNAREQKHKTRTPAFVHRQILSGEQFLEKARQFLTPSNLRELGKLPVHRPNTRMLRTLKKF